MSRRLLVLRGMRHTAVLATVTLVVSGLGPGHEPAGADVPRPVYRAEAPSVLRAPTATDGRARLDGDAVVPAIPVAARAVAARRIRLWPGNRIYYYETIPAKWQWSLDDAIDHWNGTGANIRLIRTTSQSRARLLIRYGPTYGADGIGTLGYAWPYQKNFVHLSTAYRRTDADDPAQRAWVSRLFAHEIGHNLGYNHVARPQCALMTPVFLFGVCGPLSEGKPGYYQCRYIDRALLRRHIANYGGHAKQPAKDCPLAPLPPQLQDVELTGGDASVDSVVTLRWEARGQPSGAKVEIARWKASTCRLPAPPSARSSTVPATAERWVGGDRSEGHWCYAVQVANRFGAARDPVLLEVDRDRPEPEAPTIGPLGWDEDQEWYAFAATVPSGTELWVMRDYDDPGHCRTTYDESRAEQPSELAPGEYAVYSWAASECLVFFSVSRDGRHSDGVTREVSVPAPPQPTILRVTPGSWPGEFEVEATAGGYAMLGVLVAGACPAEFPEFADVYVYEGQSAWFYAAEEGPNCLALVAENSRGGRSPMATRVLDVTFEE